MVAMSRVSQQQNTHDKSYHANNRLSAVRVSVGVILALLTIQFLMGMWLNLFATFPTISTSSGMMGIMGSIMVAGMGLLMAHMMSGFLLLFASVAVWPSHPTLVVQTSYFLE